MEVTFDITVELLMEIVDLSPNDAEDVLEYARELIKRRVAK